MGRCINGAKFTMLATLLNQSDDYEGPTDPNFDGEWVENQDPLTGEIVRVWIPSEQLPDNPNTPGYDPSATIKCVARGFSTTNRYTSREIFNETYKNIDAVRMWVPVSTLITKGDRVTNIRTGAGKLLWLDYSYETPQSIMFNVIGVTPQLGPFNRHTENFVMLERAEI